MGEDVTECRDVIDFFRETIADRGYDDEEPVQSTREEPSEY